jgi:hypothetical protein
MDHSEIKAKSTWLFDTRSASFYELKPPSYHIFQLNYYFWTHRERPEYFHGPFHSIDWAVRHHEATIAAIATSVKNEKVIPVNFKLKKRILI